MSKASESKLSALHGAVAEVLTEQILHKEEEVKFDANGDSIETGEEVYTASPATIATAVKFLKDNQITCDVEMDENMNNLKDVLAKKQKHSRLGNASTAASTEVQH